MAIVPFNPLPENRAASANPAFDSLRARVPDMVTGRGLIALGRGVGVLGDEMAAIAQKIEDEDNETAAKEADNRMSLAFGKILYGDPQDAAAGPGYFNTKRQDAVQGYMPTEQALKEIVAGEVKSAGQNAVLRRLVEDAGRRRFSQAANRMLEYAGRERQSNMVEVSEGRQAAALAAALRDPFDPVTVETSLETVAAEALDQADMGGVTDENQIREKVREAQSAVLTGVFNAYLAQEDITGAQALFEKHKDKLSPELYEQAQETLLKEAGQVSAQALGREAFQLHGMNKKAALEWIDAATDGRAQSAAWQQYQVWAGAEAADENRVRMLRNDALAEMNYQRQRDNQEKAAFLEENRRIVYDFIHGGGDNSMRAFRQANPNVWQFFSDRGEINGLEKYARNYATGNLYAPSSDGKTYFEILQMGPREQANLDLRPYQQKLTETEYAQANTLVANAKRTLNLQSGDGSAAGGQLLSKEEKAQQLLINNAYTFIDDEGVVDFSNFGSENQIKRQKAYALFQTVDMIYSGQIIKPDQIRQALIRFSMPYKESDAWLAGRTTGDGSVPGERLDLEDLSEKQKIMLKRDIDKVFGAMPIGSENFSEFLDSDDGEEFVLAMDDFRRLIASTPKEQQRTPAFQQMQLSFEFQAANVGLAMPKTQMLFEQWRIQEGLSGFPLSPEEKAIAYELFLLDSEQGYQDLGEFLADLKQRLAAEQSQE